MSYKISKTAEAWFTPEKNEKIILDEGSQFGGAADQGAEDVNDLAEEMECVESENVPADPIPKEAEIISMLEKLALSSRGVIRDTILIAIEKMKKGKI